LKEFVFISKKNEKAFFSPPHPFSPAGLRSPFSSSRPRVSIAGPFPASRLSPAQRPLSLCRVGPVRHPRPRGGLGLSPSPGGARCARRPDSAWPARQGPAPYYKSNAPRPLEPPLNRSRRLSPSQNPSRAAAIVEFRLSSNPPPFRSVPSTTSPLRSFSVVRGISQTASIPPSSSVLFGRALRRRRSAMRRSKLCSARLS